MMTPDPLACVGCCGCPGCGCPGCGNGNGNGIPWIGFGCASGRSVLMTVTTAGETCFTACTTDISAGASVASPAGVGAAVGACVLPGLLVLDTGCATGSAAGDGFRRARYSLTPRPPSPPITTPTINVNTRASTTPIFVLRSMRDPPDSIYTRLFW